MADGPAGASAAAAARRRQLREEEEMTNYPADETAGWEFKIVRSVTGAFAKPAVFNKLLEEEARAGWELLEKFDDRRVRFKRPISARAGDAQLPAGVDPYRTQYGMSRLTYILLILVITLLGTCGLWVLVMALFSLFRSPMSSPF